jgi:hypothetical protein
MQENTDSVNGAKESTVPFKIEITGDDAGAIAHEIVSLAFMLAPKMRDAVSARTTTAPADPVDAETVEPPRKPRSRAKKSEIIEGETSDVHTDSVSDSASDGADVRGEHETGGTRDAPAADAGATGEEAADECPAEVDAVAETEADGLTLADAKEVYDDLRKWIINEYINALFTSQQERTAKFRALCDHFGVAKLGELSVSRVEDVKKHVTSLIAEVKK